MLAIVDVETGQIEEPGVCGTYPKWSPDGRFISFATPHHDPGEWKSVRFRSGDGVPYATRNNSSADEVLHDGRMAIWDTQEKKLIHVGQTGIFEAKECISYRCQALQSNWSPDGKWLAWRQRISQTIAGRSKAHNEIWVAKPDGSDLRRAWKKEGGIRWAADSKSLADLKLEQAVSLDEMDSNADWPQLPTALADRMQRIAEFQPSTILTANQLWQNPSHDAINSVQFTRRTMPGQQDVRFTWDAGGTDLTEVIAAGNDTAQQYPVGWSELRTADAETYTFLNADSVPTFRSPAPEGGLRTQTYHAETTVWLRKYFYETEEKSYRYLGISPVELQRLDSLSRLSATRFNTVAFDWARRPNDFTVSDYSTNADLTFTLELRTLQHASRRNVLNAGASFCDPVQPQLPKLHYDRSVLTIDRQNRIVREVDYQQDKQIADIRFSNWLTNSAGQYAPQRISVQVPPHNLQAELDFEIADGGLWILKSSTSKVEGHAERRTTVVDVNVNASADFIEQRTKDAAKKYDEQFAATGEGKAVRLQGLTPFQLGRAHQFAPKAETGTNLSSLTFLPINTSKPEVSLFGPTHCLTAELTFAGQLPKATKQSLVLYDKKCVPIYATTISPTFAAARTRNTADVLKKTFDAGKLWLAKYEVWQATHQVRLNYKVHDPTAPNDDAIQIADTSYYRSSFPYGPDAELLNSQEIQLSIDQIRAEPTRSQIMMGFSGNWNGRKVDVLAIKHSRSQLFDQGVVVSLLVVDTVSNQILMERNDQGEVHFLDYTEVTPDQFVPMRMVRRTKTDTQDVRFQVVNKKYFLPHRIKTRSGEAIVSFEKIDRSAIDSKPLVLKSNNDQPLIDFEQITDRVPMSINQKMSAELAEHSQPWLHPSWKTLGQLSQTNTTRDTTVRCEIETNIGHADSLADCAYWTLTHHEAGAATPMVCDESVRITAPSAIAVPFQKTAGRLMPALPVAEGRSRSALTDPAQIRLLRYSVDDTNGTTVTPELLCRKYRRHQTACLTAVVVDQQGAVRTSAFANHEFSTVNSQVISPVDIPISTASTDQSHNLLLGFRCQSAFGGPAYYGKLTHRYGTGTYFDARELLNSESMAAREAGFWLLHNSRRSTPTLNDHRDAIDRILDSMGKNDTTTSLVLACLSAGWSEDTSHLFALQQLLDHASPRVRDAAAVAAAMLLERAAIDRVTEIAGPTKTNQSNMTLDVLNHHQRTKQMDVNTALQWHTNAGAKMALSRIAADDKRIAAEEKQDAANMISVDDLP